MRWLMGQKSEKLMRDFNIILFGGENITILETKKFKTLNFRENQIIHIEGDDFTLKCKVSNNVIVIVSQICT